MAAMRWAIRINIEPDMTASNPASWQKSPSLFRYFGVIDEWIIIGVYIKTDRFGFDLRILVYNSLNEVFRKLSANKNTN